MMSSLYVLIVLATHERRINIFERTRINSIQSRDEFSISIQNYIYLYCIFASFQENVVSHYLHLLFLFKLKCRIIIIILQFFIFIALKRLISFLMHSLFFQVKIKIKIICAPAIDCGLHELVYFFESYLALFEMHIYV